MTQAFVQSLLDASPAACGVVRADDLILLCANAAFRMYLQDRFGVAPVDGVSLAAMIPDIAQTVFAQRVRDAAASGEPSVMDDVPAEHDSTRYENWSLRPLALPDGTPAVFVAIADVTARVRYVQENLLLRDVLETVPIGIGVVRPDDLTILAANTFYGTFLGSISGKPFVAGTRFTDYLPGSEDTEFIRTLRQAVAENRVIAAEGYQSQFGTGRLYNFSIGPISLPDGSVAARVTFEDVTERVQAQSREAAQAQQLAAAFAAQNEGLLITDLAGNITAHNAAAAHILAIGDAPLTTVSAYRTRFKVRSDTGEPATVFDPAVYTRIGDLRAMEVQRRITNGRGEERLLNLSISAIRDTAGAVVGAVTVFGDVTERVEAQRRIGELAAAMQHRAAELEARNRFVQTVIESAPVAIVVVSADPSYTVRAANRSYQEMFAEPWRTAGVVGHSMREFAPHFERDGMADLYARVIAEDVPLSLREAEQSGTNGAPAYFDRSIVPLHESGDGITGLLLLFADVTDRVESRQRIEELAWDAAQRAGELETVIAAIAVGVLVCDPAGVLTLENAAAGRILTVTRSLVGVSLTTMMEYVALRRTDGTAIAPDDWPLMRSLRDEAVTDEVLVFARSDTGADRFILCSSAPVHDAAGTVTGGVLVFRDITALREVEQMKDEFVSVAAHELRTPLTAIKGYAELLDRRLAADGTREQYRQPLAIIRRQSERLTKLVSEMLDISRIEGGRLQLDCQPFDLSALIAETLMSLRVSSDAHTFVQEIAPAIVVVADPTRIEQVLINFISNAITYSPAGGTISVRAVIAGRDAVVSVTDEGMGIALEDQGQLFERFYRASRSGATRASGMGLGLYICREMIERHGGTIGVQSIEDVGSTFTFTIPLGGKD